MKTGNYLKATCTVLFLYSVLVSTLLAAPRFPQPPWPEATLRIYSFDSPYWVVPWSEVALYEEQAGLNESWSGYSLVRDGFVAAPVVIPFEPDAKRPSFAVGIGAVRFWISTSWSTAGKESDGSGPGRWARLLELVTVSGQTPDVKWSLHLNEAGDTIYLSGAGLAGAKPYLQSPITFTAGDWRMITLCYSPTSTVLQVDTEILAVGEGLPPLAWWETNALGLVIGSDVLAAPESLAGAEFEAVTTLARWPQKSDWQELYYQGMKQLSLLGPLGTKEEEQTKMALLKGAGFLPENYGKSGSEGEGDGPIAYSYAPESLWLEITGVSNNLAYVTVHGTVADVAYELLSKESLTNSEWAGEQVVIGAEGQDWTPTTVAIGNRTNELFFWARTLVDTDGDGLPDWWELAHGLDPNDPDTGGTGVSDGYKDGDNDGWTNLQEYQNGTSPSSFNTPPPPRNVIAKLDATGTNVIITWETGGGPVTNYVIQSGVYQTPDYFFEDVGAVGASTFTLTVTPEFPLLGDPHTESAYLVSARFANGSYANSQHASVVIPSLGLDMQIVRGTLGKRYLVVGSPPADLSRIRIFASLSPWFEVYATNLVNGMLLLPEAELDQITSQALNAQAIATNGSFGPKVSVYVQVTEENVGTRSYGFVDARMHLKENLQFLLRSATVNQAFGCVSDLPFLGGIGGSSTDPYLHFGRPIGAADYEYSSYRLFSPAIDFCGLQVWRPLQDNYLWRNFAFIDGDLNTGKGYDVYDEIRKLTDPQYRFTGTLTNAIPPPLLTNLSTSSYYYRNSSTPGDLEANAEAGLEVNGSDEVSLPIGVRNLYGLPLLAVRGQNAEVVAGAPPYFGYGAVNPWYLNVAPADLQIVDYYFNSQTPAFLYDATLPPMPGTPDFLVTNTSPVLIAPVGRLFCVAGWAKQEITNGYADKFGYLEQYFDKALKMTNGVVTTNETGILSPYGEFFPTEPGRVALITMPDLDTGERGTAVVHVVKLQLDVNHDGEMDLTFAGPDNTSQAKPFVFWVNNDNDGSGTGKEIAPSKSGHDYEYREVRSARNLEDFARLWVCGVPELPSSQDYTATLRLNPIAGSPAINLYVAAETNGGTLYLTDTNVANSTVSNPLTDFPFIEVKTGTNYNFAAGQFDGSTKCFLFEGVGIGKGELVLTIRQGTNVVVQTSAWLDLRDVKVMFEHAHIEGVITSFPAMRTNNTSTSTFKVDNQAATSIGEAKQLIVQLHGWNNSPDQSENYAQTTFKRLYWQGYQGRFAALRWPTESIAENSPITFLNYNKSEYIAFRSASGASAYFDALRSRFPDNSINAMAHSMGNIVMMEALKFQFAIGSNALNNYALMEAAVPAHCYDTNAPPSPGLLSSETPPQTPDTYLGYAKTINAALRDGGQMINFVNTNDSVLQSWVGNQQLNKPDGYRGYLVVPPLQPYRLSTLLADPREIMAFVARPRSYAVGSQDGVQGAITGAEVDLNNQFGFGTDHSGQWTRPIQGTWGFYSALLDRFNNTQP